MAKKKKGKGCKKTIVAQAIGLLRRSRLGIEQSTLAKKLGCALNTLHARRSELVGLGVKYIRGTSKGTVGRPPYRLWVG